MSVQNQKKEYLANIRSPEDFKAIPRNELDKVAEEIRSELIRVVSNNGGHLASNLGVVELTMAMHRVFNSPRDHIVFDVGHQSYVHKMLTGRYERLDTIRQAGGISGFPKREESEHDCFGTGHSSTSLSAALGFALSDKLQGSDAYTVALLGDGAFTGGMIHEALNNCRKDLRLIIILNENEMSISRNIGRFAKNLSKLRASSGYLKTKRATGIFLKKIPLIGKYIFKGIKAVKIFFKNALYGSNYFENLGLTYLGPIDGNNYEEVEKMLREAKQLGESVLVHVKTQKGKGYAPAEIEPSDFHGMQPAGAKTKLEDTFSGVFGHTLVELGEKDDKICAITAAMSDGTGLEEWREKFGDRFFDVGIAEGHALTFAAGLSANKMKPCVAIYSTFLQRGYDNILHDIALQKLPVVIAVDRAGLNLKDGPTHHGIFDVAFLSQIPELKIYTPITNEGLRATLSEAFSLGYPVAIRYPSGKEDPDTVKRFYADGDYTSISLRCDFKTADEKDTLIITHGRIVNEAVAAAEMLGAEYSVGIMLLEYLKPYEQISKEIIERMPVGVKRVLFLEEEIRSGGMGMNLTDRLCGYFDKNGISHGILATDDSFVSVVKKGQDIYTAAGVSRENICNAINVLK